MRILYTGPKKIKRVEFNIGTYIFTPECEVMNPEHIKSLLHHDRKKLFVEVKKDDSNDPYINTMKKDELIAYCKEKGIEIEDGLKKDEIIEAIKNHKE